MKVTNSGRWTFIALLSKEINRGLGNGSSTLDQGVSCFAEAIACPTARRTKSIMHHNHAPQLERAC
jgi:hypothetical protein